MAHILIVDDDEIVAELAADTLINAGHACGWVTSGEEALELLKWRRPDLLLLDQDMPRMSGSAVLRKLRTSEQHYDLPVIMFTALNGPEDEEQAIYAGAQDYIRKPFDPKFLIWSVKHLLKKREGREKHLNLLDVMKKHSGMSRDLDEAQRSVV